MIDTPDLTPEPKLKAAHERQMDNITNILDEHFDDYMVIVVKGDRSWHKFKNKLSAHGACAYVMQSIERDWAKFNQKDKDV